MDSGPQDALSRSAKARDWTRRVWDEAERACRHAAATRRHSEEVCDRLAETLTARRRSFGARDDRFALRLGRLPSMVRFVRHDLRCWLERAGMPMDIVADVTLACSEACANAVEHPTAARRQRVEIEGRRSEREVELRVRDYGSWTEQQRSELRGRGLGMIEQLMDSVDVRHRPDGTEIVMRRRLDAPDERGETPAD